MSLKIYYLDDEKDLLDNFADLFSTPDREIVTFTDPEEAVAAIKASPPDILFIDYRLPGCTGDQVANRLDPSIPKVLITGDMHVNSSYKFYKIFEKPVDLDVLEEFIQKRTWEKLA